MSRWKQVRWGYYEYPDNYADSEYELVEKCDYAPDFCKAVKSKVPYDVIELNRDYDRRLTVRDLREVLTVIPHNVEVKFNRAYGREGYNITYYVIKKELLIR